MGSVSGMGEVLKHDVEVGLPSPSSPLLPSLVLHSPGLMLHSSEHLHPGTRTAPSPGLHKPPIFINQVLVAVQISG